MQEIIVNWLYEVLKIANKNGYDKFTHEKVFNFDDECFDIEEYPYETDSVHINQVIFDTAFGKAYWGEGFIDAKCGGKVILNEAKSKNSTLAIYTCLKCGKDGIAGFIVAYKYHQQILGGLSESDRIEYMKNSLKDKGVVIA